MKFKILEKGGRIVTRAQGKSNPMASGGCEAGWDNHFQTWQPGVTKF